jgi:hypothetical protein
MARQNPFGERLENPAKLFLEWSSVNNCFSYYDKATKENILVELPFTFIVLDSLHTLKGFNEKAGIGYYSNEVRDTKKESFKVRSKNGTEWEGKYADFSDAFKANGGKYGQSVYVAIKDDNKQLVIANIFISGSALSGGKQKISKTEEKEIGGWIEFVKHNSSAIAAKAVSVKSTIECTKGATKYNVPVYSIQDISKETDDEAGVLQQEVKEYLTAYFLKNASEVSESVVAAQVEESLKKTFGATTAELTATEQTFLVKPEVEDKVELPEMGELPDNDNNPDDLPF